ncbi:1927_t:CDS:2 [Funneliformis geosporum]|uniref:1927_t:CDS:1 n=1 Tax=Funneliformis geosporum TaxID=1117311 RepID=A0A9W4WT79_9GLOM|nr:1927_t:CDS:2 [Funneliformis geosporum]
MKEDYKTILKVPDLEDVGHINFILSRPENFEKERKCDIRFLSSSSVYLEEWEFAVRTNPTKAIGDPKVLFLQVAETYGQMLLEDLVNGFYLVFLGHRLNCQQIIPNSQIKDDHKNL